jgi:hypothetical protein
MTSDLGSVTCAKNRSLWALKENQVPVVKLVLRRKDN